jgi:predicted transcriptional regulator
MIITMAVRTQTEQGTSMKSDLHELTTRIVAAYVGGNAVAPDQVGIIISGVYAALAGLTDLPVVREEAVPAVAVRKSVTPNELICLECGRGLKMLKRHLRTDHNLSVDEYRSKWGLPLDYPLVAPTYSARRSDMAKRIGLGHNRSGSKGSVSSGRAADRILDLAD